VCDRGLKRNRRFVKADQQKKMKWVLDMADRCLDFILGSRNVKYSAASMSPSTATLRGVTNDIIREGSVKRTAGKTMNDTKWLAIELRRSETYRLSVYIAWLRGPFGLQCSWRKNDSIRRTKFYIAASTHCRGVNNRKSDSPYSWPICCYSLIRSPQFDSFDRSTH
jgi:hypothetical protein